MTFKWLKSILPKGLYGRTALILLVPVITIQLAVTIVFIQRHFDGVTRQMSVGLAKDIQLILDQINADPQGATLDQVIREVAVPLGYTIIPILPTDIPTEDQRGFDDLTGKNVIRTLRSAIPDVISIDLYTYDRVVLLNVNSRAGPLEISFSRLRASASAPHQLIVLMVAISALITLISIIFLRNQVRPIRRLARAAEAFGHGRKMDYRVSGATEVRAAGQAFLDMRARIERQIEQRTLMLSGVSHDLRTPLTRLRLALSLSDASDETDDMVRDLDEMGAMLDEFLAFARGDSLEQTEITDPMELVRAVVADFPDRGQKTELCLPEPSNPPLLLALRPAAIRRALENLLGNAVRYSNQHRLTVEVHPTSVAFIVEDNGPGIPLAQREDAMRPFIRLDEARNQNRGTGVGLGLSIVMDIASSHGGSLVLDDSADLGGLKAVLTLPRQM